MVEFLLVVGVALGLASMAGGRSFQSPSVSDQSDGVEAERLRRLAAVRARMDVLAEQRTPEAEEELDLLLLEERIWEAGELEPMDLRTRARR